MRPTLFFVAIFTSIMAQPSWAQSPEIELTPGLWMIEDQITSEATGQSFSDAQEVCIRPEQAKISFEDIAADMMEGGQCTFNLTNVTPNSAEANGTCDIPEDETRVRGTLSGDWTRTRYTVTGAAEIVGPGGRDVVRYNKQATYFRPCS